MIYFIIAAIAFCLLKKQNPFSFIQNISFEWPLVILLSFGTQILLSFITYQTREKIEWVFILTFIGVIVGLFKNRKTPGVKWIMMGALLNLFALLIYGGTMPVSEKALQLTGQDNSSFDQDARHHLMNESFFWLFGDWIPMIHYVLSPGDLFAGIGIFLLIIKNTGIRTLKGEKS